MGGATAKRARAHSVCLAANQSGNFVLSDMETGCKRGSHIRLRGPESTSPATRSPLGFSTPVLTLADPVPVCRASIPRRRRLQSSSVYQRGSDRFRDQVRSGWRSRYKLLELHNAWCLWAMVLKGPACLPGSAGDIRVTLARATSCNSAIAVTRRALNYHAVFSWCCVYLWDFQRNRPCSAVRIHPSNLGKPEKTKIEMNGKGNRTRDLPDVLNAHEDDVRWGWSIEGMQRWGSGNNSQRRPANQQRNPPRLPRVKSGPRQTHVTGQRRPSLAPPHRDVVDVCRQETRGKHKQVPMMAVPNQLGLVLHGPAELGWQTPHNACAAWEHAAGIPCATECFSRAFPRAASRKTASGAKERSERNTRGEREREREREREITPSTHTCGRPDVAHNPVAWKTHRRMGIGPPNWESQPHRKHAVERICQLRVSRFMSNDTKQRLCKQTCQCRHFNSSSAGMNGAGDTGDPRENPPTNGIVRIWRRAFEEEEEVNPTSSSVQLGHDLSTPRVPGCDVVGPASGGHAKSPASPTVKVFSGLKTCGKGYLGLSHFIPLLESTLAPSLSHPSHHALFWLTEIVWDSSLQLAPASADPCRKLYSDLGSSASLGRIYGAVTKFSGGETGAFREIPPTKSISPPRLPQTKFLPRPRGGLNMADRQPVLTILPLQSRPQDSKAANIARGGGDSTVSLLTSHQGKPHPRPVHSGFSQVRIVAEVAAGRRVFSGISRSPRPFIPALLHSHLASPSAALKTSMSRAAQIPSLIAAAMSASDHICRYL
ncbi:hypothetical protein PR048_029996 [Dryococelus australis]|uniref:Uncharacterized protein n=1 Tax=Dryococelus australis TaxID=614101 RepID=A0ABQ9GAK8_9NEOP|nr:hypothetical protein PR048_029996 [Dryococelus australis]